MEIKVSIIVPVYNTESYLDRCIGSLISQTLKEKEIIIVNDGSTDNSKLIIEKYQKKYDFIKVINQNNLGVSVARNNGLKICKGEYIGFVDSDDFVSSNMFQKMYDKAKMYNSDLISCGYKLMDQYGLKIHKVFGTQKEKILINDEMIKSWLNGGLSSGVVLYLFNSDLFSQIKFPKNLTNNEDLFVLMKMFFKCKKCVFMKEKLYYIVSRQNSASRKKNNLNLWNVLYVNNFIKKLFIRNKVYKKFKYKMDNYNVISINNLIIYYINNYKGNWKQKKEYINNNLYKFVTKKELKRMCIFNRSDTEYLKFIKVQLLIYLYLPYLYAFLSLYIIRDKS